MKTRVAIANRGEVAVRIIRACQELGYTSVLIHSTPDKNTIAYRLADETIEIAGKTPAETYLDIEKVVGAAIASHCQMLHPGFGFLSENGDFAAALENAGIIFVGPSSEMIRLAGNKVRAKELARAAGVPVVPSYTGTESDPKKVLAEARRIGFPCIIKAASGGGGKGMKVVRSEDDFAELYASAQREAKAAFGSDVVFIEKYIERPRHIEVQVLFDMAGYGVHFFERECSIQRRHQKIFEETPALVLRPDLRTQITEAALAVARQANYRNAGTVEFLFDQNENFYFMELNTRLQVEHPVTELVCGVDLVHLQFAVAEGRPLTLAQDDISQRGHALEVRVYAENPAQEFLPSTGVISDVQLAAGPSRRFDFGYAAGDEVTPFYDPMIGKIITWAPTRNENIQRMLSTLSDTVIFGVHTNIEFLKSVLASENFITNNLSTAFLEEEFPDGYELPPLTPQQLEYAKSAAQKAPATAVAAAHAVPGLRYQSPWQSQWPSSRSGGL